MGVAGSVTGTERPLPRAKKGDHQASAAIARIAPIGSEADAEMWEIAENLHRVVASTANRGLPVLRQCLPLVT